MAETFLNAVKSNAAAIDLIGKQPETLVPAVEAAGGNKSEKSAAQNMVDAAANNPNFRAEIHTATVESLPAAAKSINDAFAGSVSANEVKQAAEIVGEKANTALRERSETIIQGFANTNPSDPYIAAREENNLRSQAKETGSISERLDTALAAAKKLDWGDSQPVRNANSELQMPTVGGGSRNVTDLPPH